MNTRLEACSPFVAALKRVDDKCRCERETQALLLRYRQWAAERRAEEMTDDSKAKVHAADTALCLVATGEW